MLNNDGELTLESAKSLIEKGLAKFVSGGIILNSSLKLIITEAKSAERQEEYESMTALYGHRFCLLIEPYKHSSNSLKITPYRSKKELLAAVKERLNVQIDEDSD